MTSPDDIAWSENKTGLQKKKFLTRNLKSEIYLFLLSGPHFLQFWANMFPWLLHPMMPVPRVFARNHSLFPRFDNNDNLRMPLCQNALIYCNNNLILKTKNPHMCMILVHITLFTALTIWCHYVLIHTTICYFMEITG